MENKLLETYKRRLALSEQVHKEAHAGVSMTIAQKNTIARVLANTSAYLNEAFSNSVGTQRSDMAEFKKFALDLTTVALPNLIANDLVIVKPMSSMTGYIQYLKFTAGSNKGGIHQGTLFNDPFALAPMTDERIDYTSRFVSDLVVLENGEGFLAWTPIAKDKDGKFIASLVGAESGAELEVIDGNTGKVRVTGTSAEIVKVKYVYDNVRIPQDDLPIYNAHMEGIGLEAHARRIAIYYSQMAAFQAKQEMGLDLGAVLASQACAELSYEIDTEIVKLLVDSAPVDVTLKFNKRVPVGIAKSEHYEGFSEVIEQASQVIYDRTQKHAANYMICASNVKPVLALMRGWKAASTTKINGPYLAGTINGIKVFVSPAIKPGKFVMGFNGDDMVTSAAVYAPYMAIVPTALLQFADGGNSQGFSTLYDLKLLNTALLVAGEIVDEADANANQTVSVHTEA